VAKAVRGGLGGRAKKSSTESAAPMLEHASVSAGLSRDLEDADANELRLQRGLAEIALLDRQVCPLLHVSMSPILYLSFR
jgi:hypothetical protein